MALWLALAALLVAVAAWWQARRTAHQLARVTEMYWQVKFDHGELKAKVDPAAPPKAEPQQTFVPLTRLRSDSPKPGPSYGAAGSTQEP